MLSNNLHQILMVKQIKQLHSKPKPYAKIATNLQKWRETVFARSAKFTHNQFQCSLRSPQTNNIPSILLGQRKTTQIDAPKIDRARVRLAGFSQPPTTDSHWRT